MIIVLALNGIVMPKKAASRTKKNCKVKCIGTGCTGIVILINAPTAIRAANRPQNVRS